MFEHKHSAWLYGLPSPKLIPASLLLSLPPRQEVPKDPSALASLVQKKLAVASNTGVLELQYVAREAASR